jgi:hypothetical protein
MTCEKQLCLEIIDKFNIYLLDFSGFPMLCKRVDMPSRDHEMVEQAHVH